MIIAVGAFIISVFMLLLAFYCVVIDDTSEEPDGKIVLLYGVVALCSAQYIWG